MRASDVRFLVVGEALVDVVETGRGPAEEHVGGSPANVAFGLGALGHDVELATWIGPDARGDRIVDRCADTGVRLAAGSRGADRTSVASATLDPRGQASYRFDLLWSVPPLTATPEHVHTGSIAAVLEPGARGVLELLRSSRVHATVSYDPNVRPAVFPAVEEARTRVEELVTLADVVKASDEDLRWLYPGAPAPEVLRRWASLGPSLAVLTRGAQDALCAVGTDGAATLVPARVPAAPVVDTVGAGDSFFAGLLSGLADAGLLGGPKGRARLSAAPVADLRSAVERGMATAAATVARAGAYAPTRDRIVDHRRP